MAPLILATALFSMQEKALPFTMNFRNYSLATIFIAIALRVVLAALSVHWKRPNLIAMAKQLILAGVALLPSISYSAGRGFNLNRQYATRDDLELGSFRRASIRPEP